MKLAQRQQGEVQGGKWSGEARGQTSDALRAEEHDSEPMGMLTVSSASRLDADDPYRGMSDGEMLEF